MATTATRLADSGCSRRLRWLLVLLLLALGTLAGGRAVRPARAQTVSPPGSLLGTGDFISTSSRLVTASWEEYSGGLLYLWNTTYVTRAYSTSCSFSASAVCYKWIQYTWDPNDPYNDSHWNPFQRGCMVLGADPLAVAEADGLSRVTDIYAAGGTYIAVNRPDEFDATLNPAAGGVATSPAAAALPSPWTYDTNCGGGGQATTSGCTSWSGLWSTTYGAMQLTQSGSSVTGAYDYQGGTISGTASGNVLVGTWSQQPSYAPPNDAGDLQFTLSADGRSFSGQWRYGSAGDYQTDWTGTRDCGAPTPGPSGGAACTIAGTWQTLQSNYLPISFTFQQNGTTITGTASAPSLGLNGTVSGTLIGNQLSIIVTWSPTLQGAYSGTVSTGEISNGSSYQVGRSPSTAVAWSGTGPAVCGGGGSPPVQPSGIAGTWDADNGVWTFTQSGSSVTGSIQFSGGQGSATLQGTFSNGMLKSTWHCNSDCAVPSSGGTVTLTLSSDGCTLTGTYVSVVDGMTTGTGPLTMIKRGC